jgi:hypothetical protein
MVEATTPLTEEQVMRLMEDVYVPRARLNNPELRRWFSETDAWWMDNLRGNVERLEEDTSRALALLTGMQAGDYAQSFKETTRDLRQPLATVFWRLMGRSVTVPGRASNRSTNLRIEDFIRNARADLLYLKVPPEPGVHHGTQWRNDWRESWIAGGPASEEQRPAPQSRVSYLLALDRTLRLASHFRLWAIGYQETGLASAQDIAELVKEHRPVRAVYSKDLTEVVGGLRNFIIVGELGSRI